MIHISKGTHVSSQNELNVRRRRREGSTRWRGSGRGRGRKNWIGNMLHWPFILRSFGSVFMTWHLNITRVALVKQQKVDLASEIPGEPQASDPSAVRVVIKLPHGQVGDFSITSDSWFTSPEWWKIIHIQQRLERRFLMSHSLKHIYYFVFCHPDRWDEFQNL